MTGSANIDPAAFVHPTAVVDAGVEIGAHTKIWHFCHVLGNSKVGERCAIGQNVMIGPDVSIGSGCKIQNNVSVYKGVTLEDDVFCGPSMVFTNVLTPRAFVERKDEFAPTLVKRGVTIGANATIVCGNTIGEYAMVGAGAVVPAMHLRSLWAIRRRTLGQQNRRTIAPIWFARAPANAIPKRQRGLTRGQRLTTSSVTRTIIDEWPPPVPP